MPRKLRWDHATKADLGEVMQFTCCRKVRRTPPFGSWKHPEPWAHKAQSLVRACKPAPAPDYLLLGRDRLSDKLTAVVCWSETSDGTGAIIKVAGVSLTDQGGGVGKETAEEVISEITTHAVP